MKINEKLVEEIKISPMIIAEEISLEKNRLQNLSKMTADKNARPKKMQIIRF